MLYIYTATINDERDKSKFESLYYTYKKMMIYEAKNILKDDYLAEDAVHQAFIKIKDNLDKIDENEYEKTKGFIFIIIHHTSIDMYRKLNKTKDTSFDEIEFIIKSPGPTVEEIYEDENENRVLKAILSLPKKYSLVMMFKYSHGYNNSEVAKILGLTEENVRQRIVRGKKKLVQILEAWEVNYHG